MPYLWNELSQKFRFITFLFSVCVTVLMPFNMNCQCVPYEFVSDTRLTTCEHNSSLSLVLVRHNSYSSSPAPLVLVRKFIIRSETGTKNSECSIRLQQLVMSPTLHIRSLSFPLSTRSVRFVLCLYLFVDGSSRCFFYWLVNVANIQHYALGNR